MRDEYKSLIEDCKSRVFKNGAYEHVLIVRHVGELMLCELDIPGEILDAFYAALAFTLAEVYESTLKWMSQTERELIEERVAIAVWMQTMHDAKASVCRE